MSAHSAKDRKTENIGSVGVEPQPLAEVCSEGPGGTRSYVLSPGLVFAGGDATCDIILDDPTVSGRHATLELLQGAVRVRDLSSRNGTRYAGAKVNEVRVPLGASVQLGRTVLRFGPIGGAEASEREELCGLLGRSLVMRQLFARVEKLACTELSVVIHGETGVGKSAVARALHNLSARSKGPWVTLCCGAVQPSLMESELFGHVRGAFTGASRERVGFFEAADGGTLFLDEINELPLALQPKLLRFMEAGEFQRLGDSRSRTSSVRVIAAAQGSLENLCKEERFRMDLYHRIAVVSLRVPPLRERIEDIPLLAAHHARQISGTEVHLSSPTLAALQSEQWPGNVRELHNAIERLVALDDFRAQGGEAHGGNAGTSFNEARDQILRQFERDYVLSLLQGHGGSVSRAARAARLSRSQFYRLLERNGLSPPAA